MALIAGVPGVGQAKEGFMFEKRPIEGMACAMQVRRST